MTVIFRIVISAIVIVATFYFLYWVPFAFIHVPWGIAAFLSYAGAMAAGWFAWTRTASVNPTLTRSIGYWALVVGAIVVTGLHAAVLETGVPNCRGTGHSGRASRGSNSLLP